MRMDVAVVTGPAVTPPSVCSSIVALVALVGIPMILAMAGEMSVTLEPVSTRKRAG